MYAFVEKNIVYKLEARGSNKNEGFCIDKYISRNMVIAHWQRRGNEVTRDYFARKYHGIFLAILDGIG